MPTCPDDGYPMVPVGESVAGGMRWGCSNRWHPRAPGPCPSCGDTGRPGNSALSGKLEARCRRCGHEWLPEVEPSSQP